MLLGSDALPGRFAFTRADSLDGSTTYTPPAALTYNSTAGAVSVTRNGVGNFGVTFTGQGGSSSARPALLVTAVGSTQRKCTLGTWLTGDATTVLCFDPKYGNSLPIDSRFDIALLDHARPGKRGAFVAAASSPSAAVPIAAQSFTSSTSGGTPFRIQRLGVGRYDITFTGLARQSSSSTEGVQIVVRLPIASYCKTLGWRNANATDLLMSIQCYHEDGTEDDDVEYGVLVLQ